MPERPGFNPEEEQKERYKKMTYYELLGVPENASKAEIKQAFKAKMATAHTDVGGDLLYAQFLGEAYATLKDTKERAKYDSKLNHQRASTKPPGSSAPPPHERARSSTHGSSGRAGKVPPHGGASGTRQRTHTSPPPRPKSSPPPQQPKAQQTPPDNDSTAESAAADASKQSWAERVAKSKARWENK